MYKTLAFLAALLFGAQSAASVDTSIRTFQLPDHGSLLLSVPVAWKSVVGQPPNRLPSTLRLTPKSGVPFEVLITPLWPTAGAAPPLDSATIKAEVQSAAQSALTQATEPQLDVKPLKGTDGAGYYFSATDRAPQPEEFKFMTQGILPLGGLTISFTILSNDSSGKVTRDALLLLQTASLVAAVKP